MWGFFSPIILKTTVNNSTNKMDVQFLNKWFVIITQTGAEIPESSAVLINSLRKVYFVKGVIIFEEMLYPDSEPIENVK